MKANKPQEPELEAVQAMIDGRLARWLLSVMTRVFTAYALILGIFVAASSPIRWNVSVYQVALQVPGSPHAWGVVLFLGGALVAWGIYQHSRFMKFWGLTVISTWSFFFAISFGYALFVDDHASYTGVWTYLLISVLSAILAAAHGRTHLAL